MVRPHVVFPDQLPPDFRKALLDTFPGSVNAISPSIPKLDIITDGMAEVTQPGAFHTAESAHLDGIDFAGKTGTAEVVGHDTSSHMAKTKAFIPNVWFVGVTPRRNPELVVAVLWQNGEFSYYPARIAAKVVAAYVDKQRRLAHNLQPAKAAAPVEVGAVWSEAEPGPKNGNDSVETARLHAGHFFVNAGRCSNHQQGAPPLRLSSGARVERRTPTDPIRSIPP